MLLLRHLTFHKVVYQHNWGVVGSLLQKISPDTDSEIILKIS